jgi:hypothetical protein
MTFWISRILVHAATIAVLMWLFYLLVARMSDRAKLFWVGVFSDEGTPSFSRIATGLIVLACIVWDTYLVFTNHALPDFSGQALLIGTPYGLNVAGKTVTKMRTSAPGS